MIRGALLDITKKRRFQLWRIWDEEKPLLFYILLNPSLATEKKDDKTIKRLINFTKKFSYGGFYVGNLYSIITPYPKEKFLFDEFNKSNIKTMYKKCNNVVFGWGNLGICPGWLKNLVDKPMCLDINKNGTPKHPLYINSKTKLKLYQY